MTTQEIINLCFAGIILLQQVFNFWLTQRWNKVFESLSGSAKLMIETYDKTKALLDEQIRWNRDLEQALEEEMSKTKKLEIYKSIYGEI